MRWTLLPHSSVSCSESCKDVKPNRIADDLPANYAGSVAPLLEALMSAQRILSCDVVDRCDQFDAELS